MDESSQRPEPVRNAVAAWLDERLGWGRAQSWIQHRPASSPVAALFALIVIEQIATGLLLLVYYQPGADAWSSIEHIGSAPFGWLIRGLHVWSCHLLVALALLHAATSLRAASWRRPRELTWASGWLLLVLLLAAAFTGSVLAADIRAATALRVAMRIVQNVPVAGGALWQLLAPDGEFGSACLQRMFALHVGLLPAAALVFGVGHLTLVRIHGLAEPRPGRARGSLPAWLVLVLGSNGLVALSALAAPGLGLRGDALQPTPEGLRPEWYFMPIYALVRRIPSAHTGALVVVLLVGSTILGLAAFPLLFTRARGWRGGRVATLAVMAIAAAMAVLAVAGYLSS